MEYRFAKVSDWPAISQFVADLDYFMPIDPALLGGRWLIAVDADGKVYGTLWFFGDTANIFVDYWAASTGIIAGKLGGLLYGLCKALGVRYVRGQIASANEPAKRFAEKAFGFSVIDNYSILFRSL